ncbi:hypothetical protein BDZ97DRAFT_1935452 [Flammula alnicola]|nr:hypothetical protein BDZ97DRAFT_1935452 [Flammula alnicola]
MQKMSTTSTSSSSDYSYDSETDARDVPSEASSSVTRRSGTPSKGAIVQMDSGRQGSYKSSSEIASSTGSIRLRRGHKNNLTGLALVAPPDAALKSYTQLTPPSTAQSPQDKEKGHHRSASENPAGSSKKASRDTASVGTAQGSKTAIPNLSSDNGRTKNTKHEDKNNNNGPRSDVFQRTTIPRTPSPALSKNSNSGTTADANPSMAALTTTSPIVTPSIGEGKEIHVPVAGPIVVNLDNLQSRKAHSATSWRSDSPTPSHGAASVHATSSPYSSSATSSYLRYEPGVHATAGPLPPPPRAMFNIDVSTPPPPRPPRLHSPTPAPTRTRGDIEAVKQALQLPPSVTAVLSSKSSNLSINEPLNHRHSEEEDSAKGMKDADTSESMPQPEPIHRREGATLTHSITDSASSSASSVAQPPSTDSSISTSPEESTSKEEHTPSEVAVEDPADIPAVTVVEPPPRSNTLPQDKIDHSKFDHWLKENPHLARPFEDARRSSSLDEPRRESFERPLSPLSADHTGEAPSPPPKSFRNSLATNLKRFSALPRTPSLSSRSGRRSSGSTRYSSRTPSPSFNLSSHPPFQKIKSTNPAALFCHEVYSQNTTMQRCVIYAAKINELYIHDCGLSEWVVETKSRSQSSQTQRAPSTQPFTQQPRHTSRSSMISDATHNATGLPPPLPYPSLAMNPPRSQPARSNSSVSSSTPPSSMRSLAPTPSTKGAGFFASLGRKASLSGVRKDRGGSKNSPSTLNISRPININITSPPPSAPGGPRAPPRRPQRSQTFMSSVSPTPPADRSRNDLGRRPSLFNLTLDTVIDIQADPDFAQQVDKLHALLPHADEMTCSPSANIWRTKGWAPFDSFD